MRHNTNCEKCIFADSANSGTPCEITIIEQIKDRKKIEVKNNYYYIYDYMCKFCFSSQSFDETKSSLGIATKDQLKELIKLKNNLKYYLVIFLDNDVDISELCEQLNKLEVRPRYISFVSNASRNNRTLHAAITEKLSIDTFWKLHAFLEEPNKSHELFTLLHTNIKANKSQYLWIVKSSDVAGYIENNTIGQIHYMVNVIQPYCNILKSQKYTELFYSLFITFDTYKELTTNINSSLEISLNELANMKMEYYD